MTIRPQTEWDGLCQAASDCKNAYGVEATRRLIRDVGCADLLKHVELVHYDRLIAAFRNCRSVRPRIDEVFAAVQQFNIGVASLQARGALNEAAFQPLRAELKSKFDIWGFKIDWTDPR